MITTFKRFLLALRRPRKWANMRLLKERGEDINSFLIREAKIDELEALVDLHVTAWNDTYPGARNKPTHQVRERQWRKNFELKERNWFCFVVEDSKGSLVGFATGNTYGDADQPATGQLNKIYLLRNYQRLGLGRRLAERVACRFRAMGINSMLLFSEAENPSIKFYEALGGQRMYDDRGRFHGGYKWDSLEELAAHCV
jgi:ribosomal protein S18 acetylase RimI-like enzyme